MKIAVLAGDGQWEEIQSIRNAQWVRAVGEEDFFSNSDAAVYINLLDNAASLDYSDIGKPVIINSVTATLKEINAGSNIVRINGWPTFLNRTIWEVAGKVEEELDIFFRSIHKKIIISPDESGLVSARVVAMIVNEAFFALQDGVSTKAEIDIAMKTGTNYPYGPFEWSEKIGLQNIATLLQQLASVNKRYTPAILLIQETVTNAHNPKY